MLSNRFTCQVGSARVGLTFDKQDGFHRMSDERLMFFSRRRHNEQTILDDAFIIRADGSQILNELLEPRSSSLLRNPPSCVKDPKGIKPQHYLGATILKLPVVAGFIKSFEKYWTVLCFQVSVV